MTAGCGRPRRRRAAWVTGGVSASLAVALTWGTAAGSAVAAEPPQPVAAGTAVQGPGERCEWGRGDRDDRDRRDRDRDRRDRDRDRRDRDRRDRDRYDWSWGDGGLGSLFSLWGLGDRAVRGCEGEWSSCRDRQAIRPAVAGATAAGARTGTAPRAVLRQDGTCEREDGLIEVVGEIVEVPAGGSATSVADCPRRTIAVSGGWSSTEPGLVAGASQRISDDGWRVIFDNPTREEISGMAFVYCAPAED